MALRYSPEARCLSAGLAHGPRVGDNRLPTTCPAPPLKHPPVRLRPPQATLTSAPRPKVSPLRNNARAFAGRRGGAELLRPAPPANRRAAPRQLRARALKSAREGPDAPRSRAGDRALESDAANVAPEVPPESMEEAVEQARASLQPFLSKAVEDPDPVFLRQRRRPSPKSHLRLQVEIPTYEDTSGAAVALARDLLRGLSLGDRNPAAKSAQAPAVGVIFGDPAAATVARAELAPGGADDDGSSVRLVNLAPPGQAAAAGGGGDYASPVAFFVFGARQSELAAVERVVAAAGSRPVVLVNAEGAGDLSAQRHLSASLRAILASFETCYSFTPLALQGLFSRSEGAVLKSAGGGRAPAAAPWLVFSKRGGKLQLVGSMKQRPQARDLEDMLYQSMAANSPVTKSVNFVKGLLGKK